MHGFVIASLTGHHQIGVLPGGPHKLLGHRADGIAILARDRRPGSAALQCIPVKPPAITLLVVGFDVDLAIHQRTGVRPVQRQNAFDDDVGGGLDAACAGVAGVEVKPVDRLLNGLPLAQCRQLLEEQIPVQRAGVIEIAIGARGGVQVIKGEVIRVQRNDLGSAGQGRPQMQRQG